MRLRLIVAALALSSVSFVAKAETINFTYVSTSGFEQATVSGSGSFAFAGAPSSISLPDLTSFSFTDTFVTVGSGSSTFTYGLGNLTSFAATLSGATLEALSLQTGYVNGTASNFSPENFTITSLSTNGATTSANAGGTIIGTSTGTVTIPGTVPEPSGIALLGTGVLVLAGMVRRRFA